MSTRTRRTLATTGLAALTVAIALLAVNSIYSKASAKVTPRTTTVQLGAVQATVTATGNVAPTTSLSVNFSVAGVVTEVDVKAGDQVKAGQTLAKVDDAQTTAALASAQAALTSAQAGLANAQQPVTPAVAAQNDAAVVSAQQQVAAAQSSLNAAVQGAAISAVGYQNSVNQVRAQLNRDLAQYNNDQATCTTATNAGSGGGASCTTVLTQDQNAINKDNDAVVNANQQQVSGLFKDQQSITQARNALISAQNSLNSTLAANNAKAAATPATVAAAQSQVTQAEANLATAQKNEANTTLTALSDGTVAAVSGVVGQAVSAVGTAASSSSSSGAAGAASSSSASSAFLTLVNVSTLQVVSGFAESDASRVQLGQPATISLNALPNRAVTGQVSRIDVNSTVVSNVVTYNVAVTLSNPPASIKPGMTANVSVVVSARDNVLRVPTADVSARGGTATVVLVRSGKQVTQVVTTGLVGDQSTEITSGLSEGDTIVEPTVAITPSAGTAVTTRGAGGLTGGGGGPIFGGGGGGGG